MCSANESIAEPLYVFWGESPGCRWELLGDCNGAAQALEYLNLPDTQNIPNYAREFDLAKHDPIILDSEGRRVWISAFRGELLEAKLIFSIADPKDLALLASLKNSGTFQRDP